MDFVLDTAFVLAAVAFFKARFGLLGWKALAAAFGVSLLVVFKPELIALVPGYEGAIEKLLSVVQLFIAAPGVFDLAVDLHEKNAITTAVVEEGMIDSPLG
jgi:hypothetical protein